MNLPSLYQLSTEVQALLEDDERLPEEVEAALDALLPAIEHKAAGVARWIQYQEDLTGAIKERERQVVEARRAMEAKAARWRDYLLRCMELAEAAEITDRQTGVVLKVKRNPPAVAVDDEAAIPAAFLVVPPPPPPKPDKTKIKEALKAGEVVAGCRLVQGVRLEIK